MGVNNARAIARVDWLLYIIQVSRTPTSGTHRVKPGIGQNSITNKSERSELHAGGGLKKGVVCNWSAGKYISKPIVPCRHR